MYIRLSYCQGSTYCDDDLGQIRALLKTICQIKISCTLFARVQVFYNNLRKISYLYFIDIIINNITANWVG